MGKRKLTDDKKFKFCMLEHELNTPENERALELAALNGFQILKKRGVKAVVWRYSFDKWSTYEMERGKCPTMMDDCHVVRTWCSNCNNLMPLYKPFCLTCVKRLPLSKVMDCASHDVVMEKLFKGQL